MSLSAQSLSELLSHSFDDVIDVRSPSEFAEDHVPGAINLPVLSDAERAEVGTIYKQQSPFLARKIGAAHVFRNTAAHIAGPLKDHVGAWRPLVYCWRGGQRSGAFAWALREIGWRAETLTGGYRSFRRLVFADLYDRDVPHRLVLIDGNTGTAKTALLARLKARGQQVLDLEAAAGHRGSLLGGFACPQPAQKAFESELACTLAGMDPDRPVLVEAESNKIGARIVPPSLWQAMKAAPRIAIAASIDDRVRYLTRAYSDVLADGPRLKDLLRHLRPIRGHRQVDLWNSYIDAGDTRALTRSLMVDHYDPAYTKARFIHGAGPAVDVVMDALDADALDRAAETVEAAVALLMKRGADDAVSVS